ncbi:hypothetical protein MACK_001423 [Theileria orientalis]|uniref:SUI1 domain-containing protein n=1 Tax=Theileria orientalis TaxID=68886 RepID=A0A976MCY3_THEOR|nr:hypothetical protein MACK_001423 [Theileria orientalis]
MEDDKSESEEQKTTKAQPLTPELVEYCQFCSMPYDFCDFGDKWETGVCFKECTLRYPDLFPLDLMTFDNLSFSSLTVKSKKKPAKETPAEIVIQKAARTKRKAITSVTGLHLFGVKLDEASKLFSKQFATGANVVKGVPGQVDRVDIQGDVEEQLVELLTTKYPEITEDKIVRMQAKTK